MLVLRIVYDGAPLSGKTTTLRTLAESLGVTTTTPEERNGRTLYFDWVDYVGGLFDGRKIRCQIVSVPGQSELAERRRVIVETADAVVLVADSRRGRIDEGMMALGNLLTWCRGQSPPIGVVVQANKRDAADALPVQALRSQLGEVAPTSAMVETVATSGAGVREAFVFAVRLALDRVRSLTERGLMERGRPKVERPAQLLDALTGVSVAPVSWDDAVPDASDSPLESLLQAAPVVAEGPDDDSWETAERVFAPDPMMPGGFIWPPVDGRAMLHEVVKLDLVPERTRGGDWWASGGGWRFHSAAEWCFDDAREGRAVLIDQARLHAMHVAALSVGRALLLAEAGGGRHRLWQLMRVHASLRETLFEALSAAPPRDCAQALASAASHLLEARRVFRRTEARVPMPCTLWTVGGARPVFVGVVRIAREGGTRDIEEIDGEELIARELGPVVRGLLRDRDDPEEVLGALEHLGACAHSPPLAALIAAEG